MDASDLQMRERDDGTISCDSAAVVFAQVNAYDELVAALSAICAKEHCYVGADADTNSPTSLYTLVKNARAVLAKVSA